MRFTKLTILFLFLYLFLFLFTQLQAQTDNWSEGVDLLEPVTNNAVAHGYVNGVPHVYSFAGMDSTKIWSGIHKKAFRYNTQTGIWDTLPPLPSGEGRIAASASTVKNKIYIIGGYDVFEDNSEISYNQVHIFDPETNSYLPDGAPIPIPIDDQVQAVYRDSLIYVVTGWSNINNVANVQIYDTTKDIWLEGTPVPNSSSNEYKVFGASGGIVGDTLYYLGGAKFGNNFPMTSSLRKGYINPNDPTEITWSTEFDVLAKGYRKGVALLYDIFGPENNIDNSAELVWLGGSTTSYNYNGIAYNGSGGVEPDMDAIAVCENKLCKNMGVVEWLSNLPVMDIRNMVTIFNGGVDMYVVGGMLGNQVVSDKLYQNGYAFIDNTSNINIPTIKTFPNPASDLIQFELENDLKVRVYNIQGQLVLEEETNHHQLDVRSLQSGQYFLEFWNEQAKVGVSKIVIKK